MAMAQPRNHHATRLPEGEPVLPDILPELRNDRFKLTQRYCVQDKDHGGNTSLGTGVSGSGKTTLALFLDWLGIQQGETVLRRGRYAAQFHKFPGPVKLHTGYDVEVYRIDDSGRHLWEEATEAANRNRFSSAGDLVRQVDQDALNVVFAREFTEEWDERRRITKRVSQRFWGNLLEALCRKDTQEFHRVDLDEVHELWWMYAEGEQSHYQKRIQELLGDVRKRNNHVQMWTHWYNKLDNRIVEEVMFKWWLEGSTPDGGSGVKSVSACRPGLAKLEGPSKRWTLFPYPNALMPEFKVEVVPASRDYVAPPTPEEIEEQREKLAGVKKRSGPALKPCAACGGKRKESGIQMRVDGKPSYVCQKCKNKRMEELGYA